MHLAVVCWKGAGEVCGTGSTIERAWHATVMPEWSQARLHNWLQRQHKGFAAVHMGEPRPDAELGNCHCFAG